MAIEHGADIVFTEELVSKRLSQCRREQKGGYIHYIDKEDIMLTLNESVFIGESLCEYENLYEHWSDLNKYELYAEITRKIHPKKHYKISLPKDSNVIDLIVESNFRYFSDIALYFPKSDMILVPTCHTEIIVYTHRLNDVITMIETVIERYADNEYKIVCKSSN